MEDDVWKAPPPPAIEESVKVEEEGTGGEEVAVRSASVLISWIWGRVVSGPNLYLTNKT